jgi:serine/threonine protein kinase
MTHNTAHDTDREERLNEVLLTYVEALQAGREPDRQQFLAAHPDLRPELEQFFAGHDEVERLAAPFRQANREEADGEATPPEPEPAGGLGQLGDFRLLREVGRGGMGVVYEAQQISLRRRVALKVLPFAAAIDPRQLQRFKNEALAAANLRHENIVPVHAVGEERGVHYYAMQFIEGQSLAALIAERRRGGRAEPSAETVGPVLAAVTQATDAAASLSRDRSSGGRRYFEWAAGLGRQAALALEHAHQTGVVHRDVKPANLLLDPRGQLWVTDFGLARVTGDAGLTMTGEMLGTLRYASPEQVLARRGVVDHRSDVYSLGATLYELLALRPIFEGRDRNELLRQIGDEEPVPPRAADPAVPAELETIVLKAVSKEPSERYATAQDMADDLQRFLDNRPILARRPTAAERVRKWVRRHPSVVAAAVVVLVLWSAASVVSTVLVRGEQKKAEAAYHAERQRAEEAEARFRLARRSVDEMILISEEELANRPGQEQLRKRLLRSALAYYQEFIEQRRDDPAAQADLLDTKRRVELILADLAVLRAASQLYLLCQPAVLGELRLDVGQRARVWEFTARVGKQWRESFDAAGRLSPSERGRRAIEQARADETDLAAILTPAQQRRFEQIGLQAAGPGAFREPEVVAALQLTAEQRERIRAIEDEALFAWMRTPAAGGEPGKPPRPRDRSPGERILAVLTEDQVRRWKEMTGEPVRGLMTPFGPPPGPRNGPRKPAS